MSSLSQIITNQHCFTATKTICIQQEGAAVKRPPAMGPSLQLSTCVLFWGFLGLHKVARDPYATCQISSWSDNRRRSYGDFSPTTQLAAVTLTSDPLTLKLVHGVLVSQGPFLPSLVFVGFFVFPLGGGMEQTDRQTNEQDQHMMRPPSRKDDPIISHIYSSINNLYCILATAAAFLEMMEFDKFF